MAVASRAARSARFGRSGGAGLTLTLLMTSLLAPAAAAEPPAADRPASLDRLSVTIGDLKASLAAIRAGLEGMRPTPEPAAWSPPAALCAPATELAGAPATAADELERLRRERAALKDRIRELERADKEARTGEVVAALVKRPSASPIETAAAATLETTSSAGVLAASERAAASDAEPGPPAGGEGAGLQLRADLALAQLEIAKLNDELQSTRTKQAALEAELKSLRSLTDDKIKRFMGWQ
jgi:cell division protein FtsB